MSVDRRPASWLATTVALGVMVVWGMVRLVVFDDRTFPLTFVLPLLVCVWTRRTWHLWTMAGAFLGMAAWKFAWVLPHEQPRPDHWFIATASVLNILFGTAVVFAIMRLRDRLDARAAEIQRQNRELEAQAEELFQQNEEIRTQSDELAQQAEEIENQAEELTRQNEELHYANALLTSREDVLQAVVECSRAPGDRSATLSHLCRRTLGSVATPADRLAILEKSGNSLCLLAQASADGASPLPDHWPADGSLPALVMAEGRTLYVDDFAARPDLVLPDGAREFVRSALVSPFYVQGTAAGVLAVSSQSPGHWTQDQFGLLEWAAAQCGLLLEGRRWQEALQERSHALEQANRAKDAFLASLSHELRTPLTPVVVAASLLEQDGRLPHDVLSDVRMIQRNIAVQSRLIDDLLDLTRIARGKVDLHLQRVPAAELLRQCAGIVAPDIDAAGLRLVTDIDLPETACIHGDSARLHQVVWNVLSNGVKFSPPGGTVRLSARVATESCPDVVEICVTDDGPGIQPHDLERVFEPFEQASAGKGGLGLGLSIARAITELHDGTIRATSAGSGGGTRFAVRFPLAAPPAKPDTAEPDGGSVPHSPGDVGLDILLVEDHEDTASSLVRLLERRGHRVRHTRTCESAVAQWRETPADFVISDLGLPDGTGLDLLAALRAHSPAVRAVCMSGYGMASDIERSKAAGFLAHLIKPVSVQTLEAALQAHARPA